jgi:hypothetical protein
LLPKLKSTLYLEDVENGSKERGETGSGHDPLESEQPASIVALSVNTAKLPKMEPLTSVMRLKFVA